MAWCVGVINIQPVRYLSPLMGCVQDSLVVVTNSGQGGKLPSVEDRGQELDGSSYPSLGNGPHAPGETSSTDG